MKYKKYDLSKAPFHGVISEIAREQDVRPATIHRAVYKFRNPRILSILEKKILERKNAYKRISKILSAN